MIRKVIFPLKLKLMAILAILLMASISFYVFFALDLFKKDKSAYVYETEQAVSEYVSDQLNGYFESSISSILLLGDVFSGSESVATIKKIFDAKSNIFEFTIYENIDGSYKNIFNLLNKKVLEEYDLPEDYFLNFTKSRPIPFDQMSGQNVYTDNQTVAGGIPHILMGIMDKEHNRIFTARMLLVDVLNIFKKSGIYDSYIVDGSGQIFAHQKLLRSDDEALLAKLSYIPSVISNEISKGVKEYSRGDEKFLVAFNKLQKFNLYAISEIPQKTAFKAAEYLINKSFYFGLFIMAISILIGIVFSKTLTSSLDKLFKATQKMAQGEFGESVTINSHDEIGALSDSFNFMSKEIVRYMEEMKEKARLESELEVAHLVQSSFFPENDIKYSGIELAAFYQPATECGGDWWGQMEFNDKVILFIADATGHGVPAALLTATAHTCFYNLKEFAKYNQDILESPGKILQLMNQSVCAVGSQIMMTAFVSIIDKANGKMKYANASHNPPFIYKCQETPPLKQDFKPLLEANGPRLGHEPNHQFEESDININIGDTIILYTDGIMECCNLEGKPWGKRKFIETMITNIKKPTNIMRDQLVDDAMDFYQGKSLNDDITLLVAKIV